MSLIFLDTKSSVVTSRVITWKDSQLITLLIMDKYNAQESRTVNTINNGNITLLCAGCPKKKYSGSIRNNF